MSASRSRPRRALWYSQELFDIPKKRVIERRGWPVAALNLSPSSHLLLLEIEAGSHPPAFRSANTALSSRFSTWSGVRPDSGPLSAGS